MLSAGVGKTAFTIQLVSHHFVEVEIFIFLLRKLISIFPLSFMIPPLSLPTDNNS